MTTPRRRPWVASAALSALANGLSQTFAGSLPAVSQSVEPRTGLTRPEEIHHCPPEATSPEYVRNRDRDLVAQALDGNRAAFGQLVKHHQRRVFAVAYRYLGGEADAADIVQRALLKSYERLASLQDGGAFGPWVMRIVVNLAKNQIRFHSSKQFEDIADAGLQSEPLVLAQMEHRDRIRAMRSALEKLPPKQRECVLLRIDAELSFRQIGEAAECSEASARVNYHHGLKRLRQLLSDTAADDGE